MPSASAIRLQIEAALADRIPSALTPAPRVLRPVAPTGVAAVDALLEGGFPIGAITELAGPESSGRTSLTLSFLAHITREGRVAAWVDVSDAFDPESAAAAGVDLDRMLWVRCGVVSPKPVAPAAYRFALPEKYLVPRPAMKGLHGGGCGGHPRGEVKGLASAVGGLLRPEATAPCYAEAQPGAKQEREIFDPLALKPAPRPSPHLQSTKPLARIEQALRVTDLLLQAGGFSAIVLDLGGMAPEFAARVPLATWFRYRTAAERTQASLLLLTQHACAKSSSELLLRLAPGRPRDDEETVFTGMEHRVEMERRRFTGNASNVIPLRKPPQRATSARWQSQSTWAGAR
ncbi:MAG: recombinase RecA [Terracidiphilus sp.]